MASNKTPNLGLDIWQPNDFFKRAEVNDNFSKIDAKAKENSDKIGELSLNVATKITEFDSIKQKLRKDNRKKFTPFLFPSGFLGTFKPVTIFSDGKSYITEFNPSDFKNVSTNTYYVALNGSTSNTGTEASPWTLAQAISAAGTGDTIIIKEGTYYRNLQIAFPITMLKSVNIIAQGRVVLINGDSITYSLDASTNLYKATRSNALRLVDVTSENYSIEYTKVASIADCQATKGTWYTDNTLIYVNPYSGVNPNSRLVPLLTTEGFKINPTAAANMYFENVTIVGGAYGCMQVDKNPNYDLNVTLNGVRGYYTTYIASGNVFNFRGGNIIANKCVAMYGAKDGFNYTQYNASSQSVVCNFVEIDCVGANNGYGDSAGAYNNGSTCHAGAKGIRINGIYYNNYGSNVADVQTDTQSINISCKAFDSASPNSDQTNTDFCTQQSGAKMWLYDCVAFGSKYSLYALSGTTINTTNTLYESKQGGGTITSTS